MKHFAIGDGQKRISTPDHFRADRESAETVVLWDPEHADVVIRVSVITVTSKDKNEDDVAFWRVIHKAQENNCKPATDGNRAIYSYREAATESDEAVIFYEVGLGNHLCIFSITTDKPAEEVKARMDVEDMIHTLVERSEGEQFTCDLFECDFEQVTAFVNLLLPDGMDDSSWEALQSEFDRALELRDEELAARVGLVFGEMMRGEIPSLIWVSKIDEYGSSLALDLGTSGISIFPKDMILKRFDRGERIELRKFASDTVETMERLFREHHAES